MKEDNSNPIWRRWKWEQMCENYQYELVYSDEEWSREWKALIQLSSDKPRHAPSNNNNNNNNTQDNQQSVNNNNNNLNNNSGASTPSDASSNIYFESLEQFHVFVLAHILQRPIIIVADRMLRDLNGAPMSPIKFGK
jgi:OTU domain-containing protein 7